ncbi:TetR/AcrR family transcriptional regulator C-terminal domain-containing protein [Aurantimonas sp. VKM B-3413]|uniref:TetR/AcrR family transcriptional regulator C-terminal domain-containing protein n=1 Tax=Aurantimonas sp. VKM B-3413 TaxID=2779401 RepID=UPI001E28573A|nr:TetR/AcrR family transcriptional regulator C-terminal domain-containing protein [Aurantimonas sp. VKM B-3413]MCB8838201.1 TetR/AcrR family transcriptional regulator C-terminal domain-containing protein [Aurantimonas sp. VKM B-3413]
MSARQRDVLDAVLGLVRETHRAPTMTAVAKAASCSKETLYKWFGDRDGLLTAMVRWQASRVRGLPPASAHLDRAALLDGLAEFARNWLTVISGPTSVALNRLAIGEAGSNGADLGAIVLRNGPVAMARRLMPALEAGRTAGLLAFEDGEAAARCFFGLVVRDVQIRLLLGDDQALSEAVIGRDARRAAEQFIALYRADETRPATAEANHSNH